MANRMVSARTSSGTETYQYGADNKRLSRIVIGSSGQMVSQTVYIYGAGGEKLAVAPSNGGAGKANGLPAGSSGPSMLVSTNQVYFAGRLIKQNTDSYGNPDNNFVGLDRLGSVINDGTPGRTSYLPYGEELTATANDRVKFATYTRDGNTGLDYADQRYFSSQFGRFMSADRFKRAAKVNDSGSLNKYSYTRGDPVNRSDRRGLADCEEESDCPALEDGGDGFTDNQDEGITYCAALGLLEGPNGNCITPGILGTGISNTDIIDPCPLSGIVGQYTNSSNSPTPIHDLFTADVATLIDHIFEQLNARGIVPIIEDGFRTTTEQEDRRKRYPIAAKLSWHEVGRAIDFSVHDPNFAAIEAAFTAAGFRDGRSFNDVGHFDYAGGQTLTQAAADTCTKEHPNGN